MSPQASGSRLSGRQSVAGVWAAAISATWGRGRRVPSVPGPARFDDRYPCTVRKLAGDMLHHRLHGLTLHVQRLLADLLPALLQVADSQLGVIARRPPGRRSPLRPLATLVNPAS